MKRTTTGISTVTYNTDKGKVKKLRLRINRKNVQVDKLFELNEMKLAEEYRNLALAGKLPAEQEQAEKKATGKVMHKQHISALAEMKEYWNDEKSFHYFCQKYIDDYISLMPEEDERDRRNKQGIIGFLNRIQVVLVIDESEKRDWLVQPSKTSKPSKPSIEFGKIPARKIRVRHINSYVKARIAAGIMSSSIQRELSFINKVLNKLKHLDEDFDDDEDDYESPVPKYDKDLLKDNPADSRKKVLPELEDIDTTKLIEIIRAGKSSRIGEAENICMLSACTGLRRGEAVYLRPDQIDYKRNYIWLTKTKSKKPRKVYFDAAAAAFLKTLPVQSDGRFFTISVVGFDRLIKGYIKKFNETSKVKFTFHMFRKIYITKTISRIGAENSLFAGQFLGLSTKWVEKIGEQTEQVDGIKTERQMMKSVGHSDKKTTGEFYMLGFDLPMERQKFIAELKAKRMEGKQLTVEQQAFLLDALLEQ